jgi:hypothetical protein
LQCTLDSFVHTQNLVRTITSSRPLLRSCGDHLLPNLLQSVPRLRDEIHEAEVVSPPRGCLPWSAWLPFRGGSSNRARGQPFTLPLIITTWRQGTMYIHDGASQPPTHHEAVPPNANADMVLDTPRFHLIQEKRRPICLDVQNWPPAWESETKSPHAHDFSAELNQATHHTRAALHQSRRIAAFPITTPRGNTDRHTKQGIRPPDALVGPRR